MVLRFILNLICTISSNFDLVFIPFKAVLPLFYYVNDCIAHYNWLKCMLKCVFYDRKKVCMPILNISIFYSDSIPLISNLNHLYIYLSLCFPAASLTIKVTFDFLF